MGINGLIYSLYHPRVDDAQWEGMGDVGSVRYEPALLPPMPDHKGFKLQ